LLVVLEVAEDFVLLHVVFFLFIKLLQSFHFPLNHHSILQETVTNFYFFLIFLFPPLILLIAVALLCMSILLHIENAIDDAFEELSSFAVAVQVFAHAEEKVEPVFRQENAPEERFHLLKLPLKVSKALFPGLQSIFVVLAGTLT